MSVRFKTAKQTPKAKWSYTDFEAFRQDVLGLLYNKPDMLFKRIDGQWIPADKYWEAFILHSDRSGWFSPAECEGIAYGLEEIVHLLNKKSDRVNCRHLIRCMKKCYKYQANLYVLEGIDE